MAARPADLVNTLDELIKHAQTGMLGAFAVGPTSGTDYLPLDPVQASGPASRTRCRSSSATTRTKAGCSPDGSSCCRRTNR